MGKSPSLRFSQPLKHMLRCMGNNWKSRCETSSHLSDQLARRITKPVQTQLHEPHATLSAAVLLGAPPRPSEASPVRSGGAPASDEPGRRHAFEAFGLLLLSKLGGNDKKDSKKRNKREGCLRTT